MTAPGLLLASNRGPVSWAADASGALVARRGGGGLVSALAEGTGRTGTACDALWVCAALSDGDRQAVATGVAATPGVHMLDIDREVFRRAYSSVANGLLWFTAHLLWSTPRAPAFDEGTRRDWAAYGTYADAFARALAAAAAPGARVLVQDYHLTLVPRRLRALRPDLRIGHFSHTPWAPPEYFRLLPDEVVAGVLGGMLGADAVGFLSPRWADAFTRCCVELLGAEAVPGGVRHEGRVTSVSVHALGVDAAALGRRAAEPEVTDRLPALRDLVGDRQLLLRVDRTDLSKNLLRGLAAYRELLHTRPAWRGRVVHLALAYESRHDLAEYREYTRAVRAAAVAVNDEFGTPGWQPVHLEVKDDHARSVAALTLADVLLVNPLRDGMNLVAKEGPVLSAGGLSLVLSREAGAADELGRDALLVNPYDVSQTAQALHRALSEPPDVRAERTRRLAAAAGALPPTAWLAAQLAVLDRPS